MAKCIRDLLSIYWCKSTTQSKVVQEKLIKKWPHLPCFIELFQMRVSSTFMKPLLLSEIEVGWVVVVMVVASVAIDRHCYCEPSDFLYLLPEVHSIRWGYIVAY